MKKYFVIGWLIIIGYNCRAQIPVDKNHYFRLENIKKADKDTIYALDLSKLKWEKLPDSLKKYHHLRGIKLTKNKLTRLPDYFKSFTSLQFVYLDKNKLQYFPHQLFYLKDLEYLNISRNKIGSIPKGIKALKKLKYLDIWDNLLTHIDPAFATLQQLEYIDFRGTTFSPSFVKKWVKAFPHTKIEFDPPCNCLE